MKENTIVSLADSNYFELLNELIDSIQKFEQSKTVAICILDAGLTDEQKNILLSKVDEIKNAEWDIEVPELKVRGKEWLKSQVSRAFLPKYFPGFKKYIWNQKNIFSRSNFFFQTTNLEKFSKNRKFGFFLSLVKPRLVPMVLIATAAGFYLGSPTNIDLLTLFHVLIGTALSSSGTLALNQIIETDIDKKMSRTKDRPLPSGHIFKSEAIIFAILLLISGLTYLLILGNFICSFVTLSSAAIYLLVYTPLKTRSPLNSIVGAIPGAIPPLIGWSAASGFLSIESFILFTILFLWQIPHALAIAIIYKEEFVAAGIKLLPVDDPEGKNTCRHIVCLLYTSDAADE